MCHPPGSELPGYGPGYEPRREAGHEPGFEEVTESLVAEFAGVHPPALVTRCVAAARHSAEDVTGSATPDMVERIARKHLQILATVAAERRRRITFGNTP